MENNKKGEVVESKGRGVFLTAGQLDVAPCHEKGFLLEKRRQQVHAQD